MLYPHARGRTGKPCRGEQYCLSPLPLPTDSEYAVDVAHIDVHHDGVTMDIRQGASPDTMMTAGHMLSGLALFMNGFGLLLLMIAVAKNSLYDMVFIGWGRTIFCFPVCVYS